MLPCPGYPEAETPEPSPGFAAGDRGTGGSLGPEAGDREKLKKTALIIVKNFSNPLDAGKPMPRTANPSARSWTESGRR